MRKLSNKLFTLYFSPSLYRVNEREKVEGINFLAAFVNRFLSHSESVKETLFCFFAFFSVCFSLLLEEMSDPDEKDAEFLSFSRQPTTEKKKERETFFLPFPECGNCSKAAKVEQSRSKSFGREILFLKPTQLFTRRLSFTVLITGLFKKIPRHRIRNFFFVGAFTKKKVRRRRLN